MRSLSLSIALLAPQRRGTTDRRRCLSVDLRSRFRRLAAPERVEDLGDRGLVEILVEIVVDLHDRCVHAAAKALDLLDTKDLAISRMLAGLHHGFRSAQPARRRGADLQQVLPARL